MTLELEDGALFQRMCNGDQEAAQVLYDRYARRLYHFLLSYVGNAAIAEDLTHETFLRLWKHCHRYNERGSFRAYVYRIARNVATDYHRRQEVETRALQQQKVRLTLNTQRDENWMEIEALYHALNRLREAYRDVLVLRFLEGLGSDEIAHILGKSSGSVRVLQHRALKALRKVLESMEET